MTIKKSILILILFLNFNFLTYTQMLKSEITEIKKLILHFDVNKTIIASDAVQNKDLNETINSILAEFIFAKWDGEINESYYAYLTRKILAKHPELTASSQALKEKRAELLRDFESEIKDSKILEQYQTDKAKILKILNSSDLMIFPSFYKLLNWLEENFKDKFVIYLRTFGKDLPEVISKIESKSNLKFSGQATFNGKNLSANTKNLSIYEFFAQNNLHLAIQDDYQYWKQENFSSTSGKPFPLIFNNLVLNNSNSTNKCNSNCSENILSFFFDDNASDPYRPIICPITADNSPCELSKLLDDGYLVAVNPLEAILDEDYFVNKISLKL